MNIEEIKFIGPKIHVFAPLDSQKSSFFCKKVTCITLASKYQQ